jgi:hypothetical protein
MNIVRLLPIFLSAVLLTAHFLKAGLYPFVAAALAFPFVLLVRRRWAARLVQVVLVLGALEWVRTAMRLITERQAEGRGWMRLAIILAAVAAITAASALVFRLDALKKRYQLGGATPDSEQ